MTLSRLTLAFAASTMIALPALADENDDYLASVSILIQASSLPCDYALKATEREDNAWDVTCSTAADDTGEETLYMVKISDEGPVVEQQ